MTPVLVLKNLDYINSDKNIDNKTKFHLLTDNDFVDILKRKIIRKLKTISDKQNLNLDLKDFKIQIHSSDKNKTKLVDVSEPINNKRIFCIANQFNLGIKTNKKVMNILYNVGIGSSTGSGFGSFCNINNIKEYKF